MDDPTFNLVLRKSFQLVVKTFHNLFCILALQLLDRGEAMGANDQKAVAYFAIVGLLESRIISPATRRQLEKLHDKLQQEMIAEANKSLNAAA
jgi:hypothetical protein